MPRKGGRIGSVAAAAPTPETAGDRRPAHRPIGDGEAPPAMDLAGVVSVVEQIDEQFRFLIEDRRFSEDLYHAGKPRPERAAQRLFSAVAHGAGRRRRL